MSEKPELVLNVHGHLRHTQNIDERVKRWEELNVRKFCCLCLHSRWRKPGNGSYFTNEDFIPWKKKYPDMLVGMGFIDFGPFSKDTPETISRLKDQGFEGLKCIDPCRPYNHDSYYPFYERAQELDMPILFHTGFVAPCKDGSDGKYEVDSDKMRPYLFDRIARAFPRLKIIGAHLGGPHYHEAARMLESFPNVYFDISGGGGSKGHEYGLRRFFAPLPGADMSDPAENRALNCFRKLCFGTDNPEPSKWVPVAVRIMDALEIPLETRELFWWKNADSIFGWGFAD